MQSIYFAHFTLQFLRCNITAPSPHGIYANRVCECVLKQFKHKQCCISIYVGLFKIKHLPSFCLVLRKCEIPKALRSFPKCDAPYLQLFHASFSFVVNSISVWGKLSVKNATLSAEYARFIIERSFCQLNRFSCELTGRMNKQIRI